MLLGKFIPIFEQFNLHRKSRWKISCQRTWQVIPKIIRRNVVKENGPYTIRWTYIEWRCIWERTFRATFWIFPTAAKIRVNAGYPLVLKLFIAWHVRKNVQYQRLTFNDRLEPINRDVNIEIEFSAIPRYTTRRKTISENTVSSINLRNNYSFNILIIY